ncbi:MAG: hypothetical protein WBD12_07280, partial [Candidatus Omnitrophota bacterium]
NNQEARELLQFAKRSKLEAEDKIIKRISNNLNAAGTAISSGNVKKGRKFLNAALDDIYALGVRHERGKGLKDWSDDIRKELNREMDKQRSPAEKPAAPKKKLTPKPEEKKAAPEGVHFGKKALRSTGEGIVRDEAPAAPEPRPLPPPPSAAPVAAPTLVPAVSDGPVFSPEVESFLNVISVKKNTSAWQKVAQEAQNVMTNGRNLAEVMNYAECKDIVTIANKNYGTMGALIGLYTPAVQGAEQAPTVDIVRVVTENLQLVKAQIDPTVRDAVEKKADERPTPVSADGFIAEVENIRADTYEMLMQPLIDRLKAEAQFAEKKESIIPQAQVLTDYSSVMQRIKGLIEQKPHMISDVLAAEISAVEADIERFNLNEVTLEGSRDPHTGEALWGLLQKELAILKSKEAAEETPAPADEAAEETGEPGLLEEEYAEQSNLDIFLVNYGIEKESKVYNFVVEGIERDWQERRQENVELEDEELNTQIPEDSAQEATYRSAIREAVTSIEADDLNTAVQSLATVMNFEQEDTRRIRLVSILLSYVEAAEAKKDEEEAPKGDEAPAKRRETTVVEPFKEEIDAAKAEEEAAGAKKYSAATERFMEILGIRHDLNVYALIATEVEKVVQEGKKPQEVVSMDFVRDCAKEIKAECSKFDTLVTTAQAELSILEKSGMDLTQKIKDKLKFALGQVNPKAREVVTGKLLARMEKEEERPTNTGDLLGALLDIRDDATEALAQPIIKYLQEGRSQAERDAQKIMGLLTTAEEDMSAENYVRARKKANRVLELDPENGDAKNIIARIDKIEAAEVSPEDAEAKVKEAAVSAALIKQSDVMSKTVGLIAKLKHMAMYPPVLEKDILSVENDIAGYNMNEETLAGGKDKISGRPLWDVLQEELQRVKEIYASQEEKPKTAIETAVESGILEIRAWLADWRKQMEEVESEDIPDVSKLDDIIRIRMKELNARKKELENKITTMEKESGKTRRTSTEQLENILNKDFEFTVKGDGEVDGIRQIIAKKAAYKILEHMDNWHSRVMKSEEFEHKSVKAIEEFIQEQREEMGRIMKRYGITEETVPGEVDELNRMFNFCAMQATVEASKRRKPQLTETQQLIALEAQREHETQEKHKKTHVSIKPAKPSQSSETEKLIERINNGESMEDIADDAISVIEAIIADNQEEEPARAKDEFSDLVNHSYEDGHAVRIVGAIEIAFSKIQDSDETEEAARKTMVDGIRQMQNVFDSAPELTGNEEAKRQAYHIQDLGECVLDTAFRSRFRKFSTLYDSQRRAVKDVIIKETRSRDGMTRSKIGQMPTSSGKTIALYTGAYIMAIKALSNSGKEESEGVLITSTEESKAKEDATEAARALARLGIQVGFIGSSPEGQPVGYLFDVTTNRLEKVENDTRVYSEAVVIYSTLDKFVHRSQNEEMAQDPRERQFISRKWRLRMDEADVPLIYDLSNPFIVSSTQGDPRLLRKIDQVVREHIIVKELRKELGIDVFDSMELRDKLARRDFLKPAGDLTSEERAQIEQRIYGDTELYKTDRKKRTVTFNQDGLYVLAQQLETLGVPRDAINANRAIYGRLAETALASHLFDEKYKHYTEMVVRGKQEIVLLDEGTGRVKFGRLPYDLQAAIEAKEDLPVMPEEDSDLIYQIDGIVRDKVLNHPGLYEKKENERFVMLNSRGLQVMEEALVEAGRRADDVKRDKAKFEELAERALAASLFYVKDKDYSVMKVNEKDEIILLDEGTGKPMYGRRLSYGLHAAIEAKEGLEVKPEGVVVAWGTLSGFLEQSFIQSFGGVTATSDRDAMMQLHKLETVDILRGLRDEMSIREFNRAYDDLEPEERAKINTVVFESRREEKDPQIYATRTKKVKAVFRVVMREHKNENKRPIMIKVANDVQAQEMAALIRNGLSENADIELLNKMAQRLFNKPYAELDAEQQNKVNNIEIMTAATYADIERIKKRAGREGQITIVTNLGGRGIDIKLTAESARIGGLFGISTYFDELSASDIQFRGRVGRNGRPGMWMGFWSLEDRAFQKYAEAHPEGVQILKDMLAAVEKDERQPSKHIGAEPIVKQIVEEIRESIKKRHIYGNRQHQELSEYIERRKDAFFGKRDKLVFKLRDLIDKIQEEKKKLEEVDRSIREHGEEFMDLIGESAPAMDASASQIIERVMIACEMNDTVGKNITDLAAKGDEIASNLVDIIGSREYIIETIREMEADRKKLMLPIVKMDVSWKRFLAKAGNIQKDLDRFIRHYGWRQALLQIDPVVNREAMVKEAYESEFGKPHIGLSIFKMAVRAVVVFGTLFGVSILAPSVLVGLFNVIGLPFTAGYIFLLVAATLVAVKPKIGLSVLTMTGFWAIFKSLFKVMDLHYLTVKLTSDAFSLMTNDAYLVFLTGLVSVVFLGVTLMMQRKFLKQFQEVDKSLRNFARAFHDIEGVGFTRAMVKFVFQQVLSLVNYIAPMLAGLCLIVTAAFPPFVSGALVVAPVTVGIGAAIGALGLLTTAITILINWRQIKERGVHRPSIPERYVSVIIDSVIGLTTGFFVYTMATQVNPLYIIFGTAAAVLLLMITKRSVSKAFGTHAIHKKTVMRGMALALPLTIALVLVSRAIGMTTTPLTAAVALASVPFFMSLTGYLVAQWYSAKRLSQIESKITGISRTRSFVATVFEQNVLNVRQWAPGLGAATTLVLGVWGLLGKSSLLNGVPITLGVLTGLYIMLRIAREVYKRRYAKRDVAEKTIKDLRLARNVISKDEFSRLREAATAYKAERFNTDNPYLLAVTKLDAAIEGNSVLKRILKEVTAHGPPSTGKWDKAELKSSIEKVIFFENAVDLNGDVVQMDEQGELAVTAYISLFEEFNLVRTFLDRAYTSARDPENWMKALRYSFLFSIGFPLLVGGAKAAYVKREQAVAKHEREVAQQKLLQEMRMAKLVELQNMESDMERMLNFMNRKARQGDVSGFKKIEERFNKTLELYRNVDEALLSEEEVEAVHEKAEDYEIRAREAKALLDKVLAERAAFKKARELAKLKEQTDKIDEILSKMSEAAEKADKDAFDRWNAELEYHLKRLAENPTIGEDHELILNYRRLAQIAREKLELKIKAREREIAKLEALLKDINEAIIEGQKSVFDQKIKELEDALAASKFLDARTKDRYARSIENAKVAMARRVEAMEKAKAEKKQAQVAEIESILEKMEKAAEKADVATFNKLKETFKKAVDSADLVDDVTKTGYRVRAHEAGVQMMEVVKTMEAYHERVLLFAKNAPSYASSEKSKNSEEAWKKFREEADKIRSEAPDVYDREKADAYFRLAEILLRSALSDRVDESDVTNVKGLLSRARESEAEIDRIKDIIDKVAEEGAMDNKLFIQLVFGYSFGDRLPRFAMGESSSSDLPVSVDFNSIPQTALGTADRIRLVNSFQSQQDAAGRWWLMISDNGTPGDNTDDIWIAADTYNDIIDNLYPQMQQLANDLGYTIDPSWDVTVFIANAGNTNAPAWQQGIRELVNWLIVAEQAGIYEGSASDMLNSIHDVWDEVNEYLQENGDGEITLNDSEEMGLLLWVASGHADGHSVEDILFHPRELARLMIDYAIYDSDQVARARAVAAAKRKAESMWKTARNQNMFTVIQRLIELKTALADVDALSHGIAELDARIKTAGEEEKLILEQRKLLLARRLTAAKKKARIEEVRIKWSLRIDMKTDLVKKMNLREVSEAELIKALQEVTGDYYATRLEAARQWVIEAGKYAPNVVKIRASSGLMVNLVSCFQDNPIDDLASLSLLNFELKLDGLRSKEAQIAQREVEIAIAAFRDEVKDMDTEINKLRAQIEGLMSVIEKDREVLLEARAAYDRMIKLSREEPALINRTEMMRVVKNLQQAEDALRWHQLQLRMARAKLQMFGKTAEKKIAEDRRRTATVSNVGELFSIALRNGKMNRVWAKIARTRAVKEKEEADSWWMPKLIFNMNLFKGFEALEWRDEKIGVTIHEDDLFAHAMDEAEIGISARLCLRWYLLDLGAENRELATEYALKSVMLESKIRGSQLMVEIANGVSRIKMAQDAVDIKERDIRYKGLRIEAMEESRDKDQQKFYLIQLKRDLEGAKIELRMAQENLRRILGATRTEITIERDMLDNMDQQLERFMSSHPDMFVRGVSGKWQVTPHGKRGMGELKRDLQKTLDELEQLHSRERLSGLDQIKLRAMIANLREALAIMDRHFETGQSVKREIPAMLRALHTARLSYIKSQVPRYTGDLQELEQFKLELQRIISEAPNDMIEKEAEGLLSMVQGHLIKAYKREIEKIFSKAHRYNSRTEEEKMNLVIRYSAEMLRIDAKNDDAKAFLKKAQERIAELEKTSKKERIQTALRTMEDRLKDTPGWLTSYREYLGYCAEGLSASVEARSLAKEYNRSAEASDKIKLDDTNIDLTESHLLDAIWNMVARVGVPSGYYKGWAPESYYGKGHMPTLELDEPYCGEVRKKEQIINEIFDGYDLNELLEYKRFLRDLRVKLKRMEGANSAKAGELIKHIDAYLIAIEARQALLESQGQRTRTEEETNDMIKDAISGMESDLSRRFGLWIPGIHEYHTTRGWIKEYLRVFHRAQKVEMLGPDSEQRETIKKHKEAAIKKLGERIDSLEVESNVDDLISDITLMRALIRYQIQERDARSFEMQSQIHLLRIMINRMDEAIESKKPGNYEDAIAEADRVLMTCIRLIDAKPNMYTTLRANLVKKQRNLMVVDMQYKARELDKLLKEIARADNGDAEDYLDELEEAEKALRKIYQMTASFEEAEGLTERGPDGKEVRTPMMMTLLSAKMSLDSFNSDRSLIYYKKAAYLLNRTVDFKNDVDKITRYGSGARVEITAEHLKQLADAPNSDISKKRLEQILEATRKALRCDKDNERAAELHRAVQDKYTVMLIDDLNELWSDVKERMDNGNAATRRQVAAIERTANQILDINSDRLVGVLRPGEESINMLREISDRTGATVLSFEHLPENVQMTDAGRKIFQMLIDSCEKAGGTHNPHRQMIIELIERRYHQETREAIFWGGPIIHVDLGISSSGMGQFFAKTATTPWANLVNVGFTKNGLFWVTTPVRKIPIIGSILEHILGLKGYIEWRKKNMDLHDQKSKEQLQKAEMEAVNHWVALWGTVR